ncbi:MAG: energy transducer TonB [Gemmatimonadota bacterium]
MNDRRPHLPTVAVLCVAAGALLGACAGDQEIDSPTPLYGEIPIDYPLQLWDQDVEGETLLRVLVNDEGGVDSVEVVEPSGHPAFDSAAIAGARELRFQPARRDGKRIDVWARVPVHFSKKPRPGGQRPR